ncbi:MAG: hypothetical protein ACI8P3_004013 [Saprospiraceae bacterium]|jgi:hypothetical protein
MSKKLQDQLLDEIISRFPKRKDAVEVLTKLLGIQQDAIYRRLRGGTQLTPDEIALLTKTFNLSLDSLIYKESDTVFFNFTPFSNTVNNVGDYLNEVLKDLLQVNQLPDVHIHYVSYEIPFFYYAFFPELISFKLFIWGKTVWDFGYLKDKLFDFDIISYPDEKIIQDILKNFLCLPTTEIWSVNIIDNTLSQIEYFVNTGGFKNPTDAYVLCDKMQLLVTQWRKMAAHGKKFPLGDYSEERAQSDFNLYQQELLISSNTILVTSAATKIIYPIISNPNYLRSNDQRMCEYQEEWFKKAISKSTYISSQNEKTRSLFFNIMEKKIAATRRRIESHLEEY